MAGRHLLSAVRHHIPSSALSRSQMYFFTKGQMPFLRLAASCSW